VFLQYLIENVPKKVYKTYFFQPQYFVDMRRVRAIGGNGGDGAISFLQLWCNETAGPDGGDGGNGGHILFQVSDIPSLH
jgi:GTP-binding protein